MLQKTAIGHTREVRTDGRYADIFLNAVTEDLTHLHPFLAASSFLRNPRSLLLQHRLEQVFARSLASVADVRNRLEADLLNPFRPFRLVCKHFFNHLADTSSILGRKRHADAISQRDISRLGANALPVRIANFHGRVHEDARLERRERELAKHARPIGDKNVGCENRAIGRKVLLEVELVLGNVGVARLQRLPARTEALRVLGMRPYDDLPTMP